MSSWREVCANFKMKTFKSWSKKCTWHTKFLLYLNATEKNALLSQSIPPRDTKKIIQNKWNKNTTQRKKEVQTSLLNLVVQFFCGCIIFTSPKKPAPHDNCTGSPAVLFPLHFSKPPKKLWRSADQQHALNIHEKMKVQNRNYYRTCPACRINI